jgi:broad specificity phosphatase PhoE
MKLFLARHAETGTQYKDRYVGATDVPICGAGGVSAAERLAERLSSFPITGCFSSPLLRCRQTTEIIKRQICCDVIIENDLAEINFGRWEGATFAEICSSDPRLVDQWSKNALSFTFPEGEYTQHFYDRVYKQVNRLLACGKDSVLVVSHGGVIRVMICILLSLSFHEYLLFNIKPATYAELDVYGESAVLSGLNL